MCPLQIGLSIFDCIKDGVCLAPLTLALCTLDFVHGPVYVHPDLHGTWKEPVLDWHVSGLYQGLFLAGQRDLKTKAVPSSGVQAPPWRRHTGNTAPSPDSCH